MNNVSFDDKIYLYEKHEKKETGGVAFALFCEQSLKYLTNYHLRHQLVLKTGDYHNEGFYYKSVVNDLPNMHCDRFPRGSIIYEYNIEIFFTFVCFEDELGKFERELKENKSFNS